jgi:hypothetical protein
VSNVTFEDNTIKVQEAIGDLAFSVLEECAGELESQVKRNTRVDTGQLKNSWQHRVIGSVMAGEYEAQVGSPLENAIWEEMGTGEYALEGNGRKGGWFYEDDWGVGHFTHGKRPSRAFHKAYTSLKSKLITHIQDVFKGGL